MTIRKIKKTLEKTGYPVAYYQFKKPPTIPFIAFLTAYSRNFAADGKVYKKINRLQIELYTEIKDPAAEERLETVLDEAELFYNKTETYIESENLFQIIYECEVI